MQMEERIDFMRMSDYFYVVVMSYGTKNEMNSLLKTLSKNDALKFH